MRLSFVVTCLSVSVRERCLQVTTFLATQSTDYIFLLGSDCSTVFKFSMLYLNFFSSSVIIASGLKFLMGHFIA